MSYTNVDLLRNHIEFIQPISDFVYDQLVIFNTDSYIKIFNGSITENSLAVKTITVYTPLKKSISVSDTSFAIHNCPLVRSTVVCASDSSLGNIYKENIDYVIDYSTAICTLKNGGQISVGDAVTFYFIPFTLYTENTDYRTDYNSGEIQLITSGNMQLGETLYIDYSPIYNNYTDAILNNAVLEANAIIEKQVDPNKQFGADLVLQAAATYRALEILCRSSAMRELISQNKKDNAVSWIKLAELYVSRSESLILSFKSPFKPMQNPTHS